MQRVLLIFLFFALAKAEAQNKVITGTVKDDQGPLPDVSIAIEGSATGTRTAKDGSFRIAASPNSTLALSFVGYLTKKVTVTEKSEYSIVMTHDDKKLQDVIVTALGISREKKSLGYAAQTISGDDISTVKTGNIVNALSGKAAGVQIKRNTNMGGSTNIVIRGNKSLTGDNQALFVVDGVPVNNSNFNTSGQQSNSGGFDYGNMASDINPDDVESMTVLKGAAATALYGSRAANGAIIISTKKGAKRNKVTISVNSGVTVGSIIKSTFPTFQDKYGVGYGSVYGPNANDFFVSADIDGDGVAEYPVTPGNTYGSYGAPFDANLMVYQWDAYDPESRNNMKKTPWVAPKNGPITFFETPVTTTNNLAVAGSNDMGSYRLSYTNFYQKGLLPNGNIKRNNVAFNGIYKLTDKLTASVSGNYANTAGRGRNETGNESGGNGGNVVSVFRRYWVANVDVQELKEMYFKTGRNITGFTNGTIDNPYWTRYENQESDDRRRLFGNVGLKYNLTNWLNVEGRISLDTYTFLQEERRNNGTLPAVGRYIRNNVNFSESNYDLMVHFNKNILTDLNVSGVVGTNIRRNDYNSVYAETNGGLVLNRLFSLSNSKDLPAAPVERAEKIGVDGYYGAVSLGYNNMLYLDVTGRSDHSSMLPAENSTYFYPSVATSFIFSELIKNTALSYGKVRLNYAEVGSSGQPNTLVDVLEKPTPFGSAPLYAVSAAKRNATLLPEKTQSIEAGVEMSFFKRRIGIDFSVYKTNTKNQIMPVAVSTASGYASKWVNAGEVENKGIEVALNGTPVKTSKFSWDVTVNWANNRSKVLSLFDGVNNLQLGSVMGVTVNAAIGQPYGALMGTDFIYVNGQREINQTTGEYKRTSTSNNIIGNITPDWNGGISNRFGYKAFSLSFLVDMQKGGDIFSSDISTGNRSGLYDYTAGVNELGKPIRNSLANGGGIILEGVDASGKPNTVRTPMDNYTNALGSVKAPQAYFIFDASYVKLREVSFSYNLPTKLLSKAKITAAQLSIIGSNLWIIHKNLPFADPEAGASSGNLQGGQTGVLPTTRDMGINLKLTF